MKVENKLKFSVFLPCYTFKTEKTGARLFNHLLEAVLECEQLGYHSVFLDDHLMLDKKPILECWTTLPALSTKTKKIMLGTMVSCNSFRNPSLLAKMAATVDNISNGRLELGIGAGVRKIEHVAYGYPFPNSKVRIERLGEAVQIIRKMWTQETTSFMGKYYQIRDAVCEPKPLQKPHPPIVIGGGGEKLTLKVTARYADRFDWGYLPSLEDYKRKLNALENYCKVVDRHFSDIELSCWPMGQTFLVNDKEGLAKKIHQWLPKGVSQEDFLRSNFVSTPKDCIRYIREYLNLGVRHFMVLFGDIPDLSGLRLFAEKVIPNIQR